MYETDKVTLLLEYLEEYYSKNLEQIRQIRDIINQEYVNEKNPNEKISLRILDFFITTYAKNYNIAINNYPIYQNYRLALRSFHKKYFDPFCRKHKLMFYYGKNEKEYLETSCGQLCFFKWCFEHGIVEYVKNNFKEIDHSMKHSSPKRKKKNTTPSDKIESLNINKGIIVEFK
jgi:hypothetical protein